MQGYLVNDDETPPEQLRQRLRAELGTEVAVLNTGTLGYGPEHYYYTLIAHLDRFRPQLVVVGVYCNDFGEDADVLRGQCDWTEGKHWLGRILATCRERNVTCVIAPVPCERQLLGPRRAGHYPGQVADITRISGPFFCDPTEAFLDEDLKLRRAAGASGAGQRERSFLYNGHLGDAHLSPAGAAIWGNFVARRLTFLMAAENAATRHSG
jgi:hypothetical protein